MTTPSEATKKRRKSLWWLVGAMFIGLAPYGNHLTTWAQITEPSETFTVLGIIGAALFGWLGESPIKRNRS